jgi:hypothetical protein
MKKRPGTWPGANKLHPHIPVQGFSQFPHTDPAFLLTTASDIQERDASDTDGFKGLFGIFYPVLP